MTIYCPRCGEPGRDQTVISLVGVWARCDRCEFVWRSSLIGTVMEQAFHGVGLGRSHQAVRAYARRLQNDDSMQPPPASSLKPPSTDRVAEWLVSQDRRTTLPRLAAVKPDVSESEGFGELLDQLTPVGPSPRTRAAAPAALAPDPAPTPAPAALANQSEDDDFYSFFSDEFHKAVEPPATSVASAAPPAVADAPALTAFDMPDLALPELDAFSAPDPAHEPAPSQPIEYLESTQVSGGVEESETETPLEATVDRTLTSVEDLCAAFERLERQLGSISDSLQTYTQRP